METQDVLSRLKRATTECVPSARRGRGTTANGSLVRGECCHNCGADSLSAVVRRRLVPDEPETDRNRVSLCEPCHADAPTADDAGGDDAPHQSTSHRRCTHATTAVDAEAIHERDDRRCRGCGVRERIVVGDDLHLHAVVPLSESGYRHARNYVSLCPTCHRKLHA
ncbi:hypothetical protein G9C85_02130 [Halorubellus sp. JP-L1]|uniref:HNH endonuclease n=1 Tax=Halorubellus sp. JP-L1 TaxID=2715753 RepID=UPI001407598B|nr:HNH endonuclease [Halorubellus sp. JP-L1]NHN40434.1 hypothetical protein [Halorubellus sp. JP-L1]